jgi:putative selenate reductase
VEHTLSEEEARAEALRCFQCSTFCDKCVEVCPNRANYAYPTGKVDIMVPVLVCRDGKLEIVEWERFVVAQTRQIIHVDDFCNECGNCATFCVHDGKPYADKPRLFLRRAGFEQETDNAFFVRGDTIWCREKGHESRLTLRGGRIEWNSSQARILLSLSKTGGIWQVEEAMLREPFAGTLSLKLAGQMAVLLRAVAGPLSFLGAGG